MEESNIIDNLIFSIKDASNQIRESLQDIKTYNVNKYGIINMSNKIENLTNRIDELTTEIQAHIYTKVNLEDNNG